MSEFVLGPLQRRWIERLREHPERKTEDILGEGNKEFYKACCLGEALMMLCDLEMLKGNIFEGRSILSKDSNGESSSAELLEYDLIGLRDSQGSFKYIVDYHDSFPYNNDYPSLISMNDDRKFTWTDIADYIENNPENVFTKSL